MLTAGVAFFVVCFPALFSIVDPFAAVPVYLALVGNETKDEQKKTALRATITMMSMLLLFAATGTMIFRFFGITIAAFKIAGGILLFSNALDMIRAKKNVRATAEEEREAVAKDDVAIVPLGIPVLSGPGAIASTVMWSSRAHTPIEKTALFASITLVGVITLLCLRSGSPILKLLGNTGINIIGRVMGLILAATGAQFVLDGWREAFVH